jgi:hypothetical protein
MRILGQQKTSRAFALPTVLIASVVLLSILAVSVTATATVRTALQNQYYVQLAQVAGEAGVAYAKACLANNANVPQWSSAKPLTPATDCAGNVALSPNVKALVVAGGGGGGGSTGGGGGGGGYLYTSTSAISATSYPIVVGAGGAAGANKASGGNGGNSSFNGIGAVGGGGGAASSTSTTGTPAGNGGSGGGGENYSTPSYASGAGTVGSTTTQGYAGGPFGTVAASGGGGAGGIGSAGVGSGIGGAGGPGVQNNISGSMVYYSAGGGGGNGGAAGVGGTGTGGTTLGVAGAANTGDGGGGGWPYSGGAGAAGGTGIVIISFPQDSGITATGGTVKYSGGNEIHIFTSSGTFTVTSTGSSSCPSDARCSVTVNGNVRSSFSVPAPTVDGNGRALTIPNSGYTQITRTSNGSVWRTYTQPAVQAAVVPDLCCPWLE